MKKISALFFLFCLFSMTLQSQSRAVAGENGGIRSDNKMRYYRLAIPVTLSAFQEFDSDYEVVKTFWQECEDFANAMFVPLGICFDVVVDEALVMKNYNSFDRDVEIINVGDGTELLNSAVGANAYDVAMWVTYRDPNAENTGLSIGNGAYNSSTKASGYAKPEKWVVAHELGHMFGADFHTAQGEGSLMDDRGEFFSYPSIKIIRDASVSYGVAGANVSKIVTNSAPVFDATVMKELYRIPKGACMAIPVLANDAEGHSVTYSAIGCSSADVDNLNGELNDPPHFASLPPCDTDVIDYRPKYSADIYDSEFFYYQDGTNIPEMFAGRYSIAFLANDMPLSTSYDYLVENPFYSNYSVWDAVVEIVDGTDFLVSIRPELDSYMAKDAVKVVWGVNNNYFTNESRLRITMSADYGKTFPYLLADDVPALDGECLVTLPNINVGDVDVDLVTDVRSLRGGIIRVEEIGGVAYTLTTLSPEKGGGFNVTGGISTDVENLLVNDNAGSAIYDIYGRVVEHDSLPGIYIKNGKKHLNVIRK